MEFPAPSGQFETAPDAKEEATLERTAWIWTYALIMREEGETIGKVDEEFFASVFSGLGRSAPGRALDIEAARARYLAEHFD